MSLLDKGQQKEETLEQFLARGGRIQRIEDHPDPDGRVLRRGQHLNAGSFRPWTARPLSASFWGPADLGPYKGRAGRG